MQLQLSQSKYVVWKNPFESVIIGSDGFLHLEKNMIKNILFDLDDTILDFKMAERVALTKALNELGISVDDYIVSQYSKYNISQWKRLELGEITREQVKVNRFKLLFDELKLDLSPERATALYEDNLCIGHYFMDGAPEILEELSVNYNLYLVSNGAKRVQDSRLASAGISKYFKGVFISEVVGCEKPNREFFDYCFSQIQDFKREETIIIGDSLSSDIKGGINAGIKTVWFNHRGDDNSNDITPDYVVKHLSEIKAVLDAL